MICCCLFFLSNDLHPHIKTPFKFLVSFYYAIPKLENSFFFTKMLDEHTRLQLSVLYHPQQGTEKLPCTGVQQHQQLLPRAALGRGCRQSGQVEVSSSSLAILPDFPSHPSEDSQRAREEMLEGALSCLQEATGTPHLLADDHCLVRARDFPTAVLHCWASVHTDPDPKLPLKPVAFFPVTAQGFGCGPLQPVALAAAKILACVLQAME